MKTCLRTLWTRHLGKFNASYVHDRFGKTHTLHNDFIIQDTHFVPKALFPVTSQKLKEIIFHWLTDG